MEYVSKQDERAALAMIRKIVEELGEDSYIGTAFSGCFEIAEENIELDMGCSLEQKLQEAEHRAEEARQEAENLRHQLTAAGGKIERLERELDTLYGWEPWEEPANVPEEKYRQLLDDGATRELTDAEAKQLLHTDFGFDVDYIEILQNVDRFEHSERFGRLRHTGTIERKPLYNASDWNYIRFNCGAVSYELSDGDLRFYLH